jgi:MFS transporter, DHA1 family, tetracycline resistance protein
MTTVPTTGPSQRRQLGVLFLIVFINLVGFGIVLPAFPFFGTMVGATPGQTTLAMAAYSLGQFAGSPVWGKISDRYGRRPVLIWSLAGAVLSYVVMAHATDIWTLGLARLFGGLMAGNIAAAFAYVGDVTTDAERPKAMGMIGAAFGLGFIFGPAIGGLLAGKTPDANDFLIIGYASAALTALAAVAAWVLLPESLTPDRRGVALAGPKVSTGSVLAAKPAVWALMLLTLLMIGSASLMETSFAFSAHELLNWGPLQVGLAFGGVGLISTALQGGAAGPLAKRFTSSTLAIAGVTIYAAGLLILTAPATVTTVLVGLAVAATGLGLFNPAFQTMTAAQSNDSDRGLIVGLTQGASSLGRVIGPSVSGSIYQGYGPYAPYQVGAAALVIAFGAGLYVARRQRLAAPSTLH